MEDPLDMRDELETESLIDLEDRSPSSAEPSTPQSQEEEDHPLSLFSNREEEPGVDDTAEDPVDLLMKSGQPRLSLVRGDDELDEEEGLIELAPADPTPTDAEVVADTWPWLADTGSNSIESDDEAPLLKSLEAQFDADLIAPTACGARPTSLEVKRKPMPSLPKPGEIASVAQRVGVQFAAEAKTHRTPDVPALLATMPKTFAPAAPVMISCGDRPTISPTATPAPAPVAVSAPATAVAPMATVASVAIPSLSVSTPAIIPPMPATIVSSGTATPATPAAPRKSPDTPKRIGDGKLVQSRLTWKPGDPFAEGARPAGMPGRFRWELMLSTACGTAVFGLAFFWIMRMVF